MTTNYVAGFMFREFKNQLEVALIRKQKGGAFQVGKLNGIGGKIEKGEAADSAMVREFREETGATTFAEDWRPFAYLHGPNWGVHFFVCKEGARFNLSSMESEQVGWYTLSEAFEDCVPNLRWLMPLALDKDKVYAAIENLS